MAWDFDVCADVGQKIVQSMPERGTFATYLIASALVGLALQVRLAFVPIDAGYQYITFFPVVTIAAIIGGLGPGLFSAILGAVCAQFFFTYPYYSFSAESLESGFWASVVFLFDGVVVSLSIEAMHRFRYKATEELNEVQQQNNQIRQLQQETEMLHQHTQLLMQNSMDGIHVMDMQGNIVMANDAFCRMLGYTQQEAMQLNLLDWSEGLSADKVAAIFKDRIGKSIRIEAVNRRKDGGIIDVEISVTGVLVGEQGFVYASSRDITERKKAEAEFKAIIQTTPDGFWITSLQDARFLEVNPAYCDMSGYSRDELLQMTISDLEANEHPEETRRHVKAVIDGRETHFESRHRHKDGHLIDVEISAQYMDARGGCLVVFVRDITARKKSELGKLQESDARFRGTFEQVAVGIAHAGMNGEFEQVNQKFSDIVGYSRDELLRMSFRDITFAEDLDENLRCIRQLLAGEISTFAMEKRYVRRDGTLVWVDLTVSLLRDADGMPNYTIAVVEDISERKCLERQMRDLSMHLQTVREEEKASVAREIHDSLGGTLTALKMDVYWLADEMAAYHGMDQLLEHVKTMSQLLDNAVDVTRRVITDLRPTILDDLGLQAALEWQAGQFQKRTGIQCRVTCIEDFVVELDKIQSINLFRIFQESLTNVARHSGASDVDAELRYEANGIVLIINDNGCGLQEGHTIASTSYGMLGMRERAEQLGGEIYFSGSPDAGFSVTVILPLDKDTLKGEGHDTHPDR